MDEPEGKKDESVKVTMILDLRIEKYITPLL
jgi:hypothetical protein